MSLKPIKVTSDMSNEQVDVCGVLSFAFEMNKRLQECRERGKSNWYRYGDVNLFISLAEEAIEKQEWIGAANYLMMIYHLEKK